MALVYMSVLSVAAAVAAAPVPINVAENVTGGAASAEKILAASNSSQMLAAQFRALVADGRLKEIRIVAPEQAINRQGRELQGWYDSGIIYLTTDIIAKFSTVESGRSDTLDYSTNNPNDLVFLLGFLAERAQNAASNTAEIAKIQQRMKDEASKLRPDQPFNVTPMVNELLAIQLGYAARAYINGWGVMREAAETKNGKKLDMKSFAGLMMKSRTLPLLHLAINKPNFSLGSDGRIRPIAANVGAVSLALQETPMPEFD
ncbi:hypothetical protein [Sandaracinobacteroides hominis]|uniref:hypothetical protein n=1 Tax=Sandaracinobacteroides hominis TaxID=2780086 RepID=UPI0018F5B639|nr:hypothetical protein [Sandaracinobacteroides hominis]